MSRITVQFTMFVVVLSIIAGIVAVVFDTKNAAAQSHYLAPSFDTAIVKHADIDPNARMDIPFGSDDAAYRAAAEPVTHPTLFSSLLAVVLPGTSAPHGSVTCTMIDNKGIQFTVTRNSCDSL